MGVAIVRYTCIYTCKSECDRSPNWSNCSDKVLARYTRANYLLLLYKFIIIVKLLLQHSTVYNLHVHVHLSYSKLSGQKPFRL